MIAVDQSRFELCIDGFLHCGEVSGYIKHMLTSRIENCFIVTTGSFPLISYLPSSDLDIVFFIRRNKEKLQDKEMKYILQVFNAICQEIAAIEDEKAFPFQIRNVEFINARIKLSKCYVNNIGVDITVNQVNSLATLVFLEEADRLIGKNNLFKRSLILIKTWCIHESVTYCGVPLIGSRSGALTSYAVSVMVLFLFNKFTVNLCHPFSVLRCFLFTYANFNWRSFVLSLGGPLPTINGRIVPQNREEDPSFLSTFNRFEDIQRKIQRVVESGRCSKRFQIRLCNIRDPVDASNNLGVSVTAQSLHYLNLALVNGSKHLETLLHNSIGTSHHPQENFFFLQDFFPRSCEALLSETQVRSDIKDHPLQLYDAIEASALRAACYPSLLSLEGDLDAMWRNLKTACEICALNDVGCLGSHSITTPRSVETTKALPSLAAVPEEKTEKLVVDKRTTEDETASRSLEEEELRYKDMEGMKAGGDVILLQEKEEEMAQTLKEEEGSSGPLEEPPMGVDDAVASGIDASEQMTIALMGTSGEEPERESSEEKASTESLVSLKEIATSGESLKQFDYIESRLEFTENLLLATVSSNHQPRQQHMGRNQRRRKSKRKKEMMVEPHASPSSPVLTIETKASLEVSPEIDWAYEGGDPELDSSTSELSVLSTVTQLGENGHFSGNNSSSKLLGELLNIRRDSLSSGRTDVEESCLTRQDDYGDQQQHTEVDTLCVSYPALTTAAYPSTISSELVSSSSAQVPLVAKGGIVESSSGHFSLLNLPQLLSPENYHATSPGWSGSSVALRRRLYTATCLDAANGVSSGAQRVSEHQARDPKELSVTTAADTKKVEEEDAPLPQPLDWQRLLGGGLFVLFVVCMPIVLRSMLSLLRNDLPSSRNRGMQRYFANEPDKTNPFMSYSIPPRGPSSTALKNIENFQPLETITPSLHYVNIGDSVSFGLRRSDEEIEEEIFALTSYAFVGWWKNGVQVTGAPPRLSFTIQRVTLEDVGEYECFVRPYSRSSSVGSSGSGSGQQESLRLVARASLRLAEPPVVKMKFSYSELQVGQELKVAISVVEGTPAPSFQWFRNGVSLPGQREEKLYYPSVEPGHAGTYSCLVENMAGGVMWLEATVSVRPPLQHSSSHAHHPR